MQVTIQYFRCVTAPEVYDFRAGAITMLSGRSGIGKSTILSAIEWCLYGGLRGSALKPLAGSADKTSRSRRAAADTDLTNTVARAGVGPGGTLVCINIPTVARIERRGLATSPLTVHAVGIDAPLTGPAADAWVVSMFGTHKLWAASSYIKQNTRNILLSASAADRYALLYEIAFGADVDAVEGVSFNSAKLSEVVTPTGLIKLLSEAAKEQEIEIREAAAAAAIAKDRAERAVESAGYENIAEAAAAQIENPAAAVAAAEAVAADAAAAVSAANAAASLAVASQKKYTATAAGLAHAKTELKQYSSATYDSMAAYDAALASAEAVLAAEKNADYASRLIGRRSGELSSWFDAIDYNRERVAALIDMCNSELRAGRYSPYLRYFAATVDARCPDVVENAIVLADCPLAKLPALKAPKAEWLEIVNLVAVLATSEMWKSAEWRAPNAQSDSAACPSCGTVFLLNSETADVGGAVNQLTRWVAGADVRSFVDWCSNLTAADITELGVNPAAWFFAGEIRALGETIAVPAIYAALEMWSTWLVDLPDSLAVHSHSPEGYLHQILDFANDALKILDSGYSLERPIGSRSPKRARRESSVAAFSAAESLKAGIKAKAALVAKISLLESTMKSLQPNAAESEASRANIGLLVSKADAARVAVNRARAVASCASALDAHAAATARLTAATTTLAETNSAVEYVRAFSAQEIKSRAAGVCLIINNILSEMFDTSDPMMVSLDTTKRSAVGLVVTHRGVDYDNINLLSGGETDRLSLAITVAFMYMTNPPGAPSRPAFLLLDECLNSLDEVTRTRCFGVLRRYQHAGCSIVNVCPCLSRGAHDHVIDL